MPPIDYSAALEKRATWLRWASESERMEFDPATASLYRHNLSCGDTFVMNHKFCELVDLARRTLPDDLKFEAEWMLAKHGWLYLHDPFPVPEFQDTPKFTELIAGKHKEKLKEKCKFNISAIGWMVLDEATAEHRNKMIADGRVLPPETSKFVAGATQFMCYLDYGIGFGIWSYFVINPGDIVLNRVRAFEDIAKIGYDSCPYGPGDETDKLHEVRWIYTAFHLMSQKLATTVKQTATRGTRKRFERDKTPVDVNYRVVTLRRMEEDRKKAPDGNHVDWNWCWKVDGFWRNQWYPSENVHKQIWIDEYVKGDFSKPMKPKPLTIYKAAR